MSGTFGDVVHFEEFDTVGNYTVLNSADWEVYSADPGNNGFGVRSQAAVNVVADATSTSGGNVLRIDAFDSGGEHFHGGVKLLKPHTYMQAELRVKVDDDPDEVTSGVVIFWPVDDQTLFPLADNPEGPWPAAGELDFWETFDNRDTRTPTKSYVHRLNPAATPPYTSSDDEVPVEITHTGVDQSEWHKIVCSWTPNRVWIEIDDGPEVTITDDPANIPDWDMELTLQLDAWSDTPPSATRQMRIDYVLIRPWIPPSALPEGDLDSTDSNIEAHQTIHSALNLIGESTSIAGDMLDVIVADEAAGNTLGVSAPSDVKSAQIQTVTHDSSGALTIPLKAETKAVVVEASAPISGLTITNGSSHGDMIDLPVLLKAVGVSVSVDLGSASLYGNPIPSVIAAGDSFPTRVISIT